MTIIKRGLYADFLGHEIEFEFSKNGDILNYPGIIRSSIFPLNFIHFHCSKTRGQLPKLMVVFGSMYLPAFTPKSGTCFLTSYHLISELPIEVHPAA